MPLNIFARLMPPTEDFTKLFCGQAGYVVKAAEQLRLLVNGDGAADRHIAAIRAFEMEADMHAMADAVVESARMLEQAMPYLDSINRDYKTIFALCEKIGQAEGRADDSFDRGLLKLRADVAAGALDTLGYIDRKELYELIEHVVDKCDDVANALQRITAKHV